MSILSGIETRVNNYGIGDQNRQQAIALADGGWVVTWESFGQDGSSEGVYQQAYNANGTARGDEVQVNTFVGGNQFQQQITALADGGWVVSWVCDLNQDSSFRGVYQQAYYADGSARGTETLVNTTVEWDQSSQQMTALADGGWVVTWISDGNAANLCQQAYNRDGTPRGDEVRVSSYVGSQFQQQITALADGGWVVTWTTFLQDGSGYGVYQRAYNANGAALGMETRVNTFVTGDQLWPQITALSEGGWVVTWTSGPHQDGSQREGEIYQQVYNPDGTVNGVEVRVNSLVAGDQYMPQITALADGGWVVTWTSMSEDGTQSSVCQQAYNGDGSPRGVEARVNAFSPYTPEHQTTALSGGGWVVTWSQHKDGSGVDVYQQAYNADGSADGGEVLVNTYVKDHQRYQQITALADGGWVVTWTSAGQDGSSDGVYQRVFHIETAPAGSDKSIEVLEDAPHTFATVDFGFTDVDGDNFWGVKFTTLPNSGTLTLNGQAVGQGQMVAVDDLGGLVWTPSENSQGVGVSSFTFQVVDDSGTINIDPIPNTITFNITGVNDAPLGAVTIIGVAQEDQILTATNTLIDGDGLGAVSYQWQRDGVDIDGATGATYLLTQGDVGASITVVARYFDGEGKSESVTSAPTASVANVNDAPVVAPVVLAAITEDGGARLITQAELLAGATDVDGPAATVTALGLTSGNGTLHANGNGTWTYTPADNDNTSASFSYTVTDGSLTATGSASLDITPVNDAPVIAYSTPAPFAENGSGVVYDADATDVDAVGALTYALSGTDAALFHINPTTGEITFAGAPDFENPLDAGHDNVYDIEVQVSDGSGGVDTQAIAVGVTNISGRNFVGTNGKNTLVGTGEEDTISGRGGNDRLNGGAGNDWLNGGASNDVLKGDAGNDVIYGGAGRDTLAGGAGYDNFVFNTAISSVTNVDRITDFNVVQDTIWLENGVMRGLGSHLGTLAPANFWKSTTGLAHDGNDRIIYETDTGWLNYDSNGRAAGGAVHIAKLAPNLALTHADFFVV